MEKLFKLPAIKVTDKKINNSRIRLMDFFLLKFFFNIRNVIIPVLSDSAVTI